MCCLTQSRRKPHVISCRANEAIQFTRVLISTSQKHSTPAQDIHLSQEGFKLCIVESCWDLATYFHELIVNSGGINDNVMNNVHLHVTS